MVLPARRLQLVAPSRTERVHGARAPEAEKTRLWPLVALGLAAAAITAAWLLPQLEALLAPPRPPLPCGEVVQLSNGLSAYVECERDDLIRSGDSGPP